VGHRPVFLKSNCGPGGRYFARKSTLSKKDGKRPVEISAGKGVDAVAAFCSGRNRGKKKGGIFMPKKIKFLFLVIALLSCFIWINAASAQVVDPCWYGCPKDGCPGCGGGGGPINAKSVKLQAKECKSVRSLRLNECRQLYKAKADKANLKACRVKDKALFDECVKVVK
jgi:hypothetical protein